MILVVDIGNTNTHFGVYAGDELEVNWSVPNSVIREQSDSAVSIIKDWTIHKCTISCVVPSLIDIFDKIISDNFGFNPLFISHSSVNIPIHYNNPSELGVDRIVNTVAAIEIYGTPCIVVDFGTATTFDVVSEKGEFMGGVIAPGIAVSMETLWTKTEKLPPLGFDIPKMIIGKSTIDCMRAGIFYGFIGQVDGIIEKIRKELTCEENNIIATGGLSCIIGPYSKYIKQVDPLLTLKGLKMLSE